MLKHRVALAAIAKLDSRALEIAIPDSPRPIALSSLFSVVLALDLALFTFGICAGLVRLGWVATASLIAAFLLTVFIYRTLASANAETHRCYAWTFSLVARYPQKSAFKDLAALLAFVSAVAPLCGPLRLVESRGENDARYVPSQRVVKLGRSRQNPVVLMHEVAHAYSTDGHGPQFCAVFATLLVCVLGIPASVVLASAEHAGIRIATRPTVPKEVSSKDGSEARCPFSLMETTR